jgi:hypothetical protein
MSDQKVEVEGEAVGWDEEEIEELSEVDDGDLADSQAEARNYPELDAFLIALEEPPPDDMADEDSAGIAPEILIGVAIAILIFWDRRAGRYYVDDDYVRDSYLEDIAEARIIVSLNRLRDMFAAVTGANVDVSLFQDSAALELKRLHTQMMALGRGGWDQATPADWGRIGAKLKGEYGFLQGMIEEIAAGNLSQAEINRRLDMYSSGAWSSYWKGRTSAKKAAGFNEEIRILDVRAQHCVDCLALAGHWEKIGTLPEPGEESQCIHNCRCTKRYRR